MNNAAEHDILAVRCDGHRNVFRTNSLLRVAVVNFVGLTICGTLFSVHQIEALPNSLRPIL